MATTEFIPFATGAGNEVTSQVDYAAATWRDTGYVSGILTHQKLNKPLRQASMVASAVTQAIADLTAQNIVDDGNLVTLVSKLKQVFSSGFLSAEAFGAVGTGDETTVLKAAMDAAIAAKRTLILRGAYTVSGPITNLATLATGELHLECDGDVTITVDAGATAFSTLISCYTTAVNNSTKTGGRLTLNLNNKCANGILLRHAGTAGGSVHWGPITVLNAKNNANVAEENQALNVYGRYVSILIDHPIVDGVDRVRNPTGACKGISISDAEGQVTLISPQVSRVLAGPGQSQDADGISVFGFDSAGNPALYRRREGFLQIYNAVITDCQGRSIKTQISKSLIVNPRIVRKMVVAFATADIDHQVGGHHVILHPSFDWRKNGATSPVPTGFYPIACQARCSDSENRFEVVGGLVQSAVAVERFVFLVVGGTALESSITVDGIEARAVDGLATAMYTSGLVEFYENEVEVVVGSVHFDIRNNRVFQAGSGLLAYSGGTAANATKFSFDISDNVNTGAMGANSKVLRSLSGTTITQVKGSMLHNNVGFIDYLATWVFDVKTLAVGTRFSYDRASSTVTNGPTIAAGTTVSVECLGAVDSVSRVARLTVDNAGAMTEHWTQTGAWGTI